jgi:hypothetical protein
VADETKRGTLAEPPARCLRCGEARPAVEFRSRASLASEVRYNHSCSSCLRKGARKGRAGVSAPPMDVLPCCPVTTTRPSAAFMEGGGRSPSSLPVAGGSSHPYGHAWEGEPDLDELGVVPVLASLEGRLGAPTISRPFPTYRRPRAEPHLPSTSDHRGDETAMGGRATGVSSGGPGRRSPGGSRAGPAPTRRSG